LNKRDVSELDPRIHASKLCCFSQYTCRYRGEAVKLDSRVNLMVWQAAFLAGFAVVYGIDNDYSNNSLAEMVLYNGFQRLAWSLALGWVIFSCTKGLSKQTIKPVLFRMTDL
jgi:hypothetical protein